MKTLNRNSNDWIIDIVIPFMCGMIMTVKFMLYGTYVFPMLFLAIILFMAFRNPVMYKKRHLDTK